MQKLTHTVSKEKLLSIPFPKNSEMSFILVDIKAYLADLKRDIQLDRNNEDWHKSRITSVWSSTDPEASVYCAKLAKICTDDVASDCVDVQSAVPSKYSTAVLKSNIQLDLC